MDLKCYRRWWDYTAAYDEMIRMTDTPQAPWWIVPSDDKKARRINCISHILKGSPTSGSRSRSRSSASAGTAGRLTEDRGVRNVVPAVF